MMVLPDSNVLLLSVATGRPEQPVAEVAILRLAAAGHTLHLVPQLLYESWVVATRPTTAKGFGKTAPEAAALLSGFRSRFPLLPDNQFILPEWERFVTTYAVLGKKAHDARLVAAMSAHHVSAVLTFNDADFRRFPGITVLTPAAVLAAGP